MQYVLAHLQTESSDYLTSGILQNLSSINPFHRDFFHCYIYSSKYLRFIVNWVLFYSQVKSKLEKA